MPTIIDGVNGVNKVAPGTVTDTSLASAFEDTLVRTTEYPGYNYIINGNFDIWQRGTSQTSSGYGSADRWTMEHNGSTKTSSRQTFAVGASFPDGTPTPEYYNRTVATSVAGAANYVIMQHRIESVKTLAGKKATLAFYAKAEASKNIAISFKQYFGTGGSPSDAIAGIGSQKVTLTTMWQRFVVTVDIPSITGKTLGTSRNDFIDVTFWFDAGSNLAVNSANLGQQSGTFDIAAVSLVEGDKDIKPIPRSVGEELALCQRYYEACSGGQHSSADGVGGFKMSAYFNTTKRVVPVVTTTQTGGGTIAATTTGFLIWGTSANTPIGIWTADAEL